ncbi:hypothetical protein PBF_15334 [Cytobacillus firmus DS1]|uniref:Uncharacterized protein n=1 Tax=Cytobacillus firmus DS1 TaxID=1307436 RepID=W7KV62_CYTFI|nr:hypothetical protein PBF_15334 [Cytobacillus firmus DS1]
MNGCYSASYKHKRRLFRGCKGQERICLSVLSKESKKLELKLSVCADRQEWLSISETQSAARIRLQDIK